MEITVNGIRLAYIEREAPSGQTISPILLLHALLATAETLTELIAGLSADRRIVAIDLLSARPADKANTLDVHQASLASLILDFMSAVGLLHPVLIGHSHGGVLALRLAATDPTAFKGLVLMSPAHPFGGYRSRVVNFYLRQPGRMLALSIPLAPNWLILRAYNQAAGSKSRIRMRHLRPHLRVLRNRNTLRRVLEILRTWDQDMDGLREVLTNAPIATPTLLLWETKTRSSPSPADPSRTAPCPQRASLRCPGRAISLAEEAPKRAPPDRAAASPPRNGRLNIDQVSICSSQRSRERHRSEDNIGLKSRCGSSNRNISCSLPRPPCRRTRASGHSLVRLLCRDLSLPQEALLFTLRQASPRAAKQHPTRPFRWTGYPRGISRSYPLR